MGSALTRLLAAHTPLFEHEDLPQNSAQYADLDRRSESHHRNTLYDYSEKLLEGSKGGITDAEGDPSINFETLVDPKPNAQKSLNGSAIRSTLRILADRLSSESDPLTRDQENYGSGSHLKAGIDLEKLLMDPETSSTYSRETNVNRNTTDKGVRATVAKDVHDGDFDPAGRQTGDRLITQDPRTDGYLNVHSGVQEALLEALAGQDETRDQEVDADADPRLWNMANQPLGQAG